MPVAVPAASLPAGGLLQLTLSLLLVLGVIFAVAWVVKRLNLSASRASRAMQVLDELAVGPRERVVLVRIGDAQVLIGVAANGITTLMPLAAPIRVPDALNEQGITGRFKSMMQRAGGDA